MVVVGEPNSAVVPCQKMTQRHTHTAKTTTKKSQKTDFQVLFLISPNYRRAQRSFLCESGHINYISGVEMVFVWRKAEDLREVKSEQAFHGHHN